MSQIKIGTPVIHIPSFKEYKISGSDLLAEYLKLGVNKPFPISDSWYYHTDIEGWSKILPDILLKSNLYKQDRFDCEDYAMKAQVICAERYGLNTLRYTYGLMPLGHHGFNSFWTGDEIMLFEPNEGYEGDAIFAVEGNGYKPLDVLL